MKAMIKLKRMQYLFFPCLFIFISSAFSMYNIFHVEHKSRVEVMANLTTATLTDCILKCNDDERCQMILKWTDNQCVLMRQKLNQDGNDKHDEDNTIEVLQKISEDVTLSEQLNAPRNVCCPWSEFSPCDVSCGWGKRMRQRTCYNGTKTLFEKEMEDCNHEDCPTCMWKNTASNESPKSSITDHTVLSWETCQKECNKRPICQFWEWTNKDVYNNKFNCYMKSIAVARRNAPNVLLGMKNCTQYPD